MKNRYYMLDMGDTGRHDGTPISTRDAATLRCGRYTSLDRAMRDIGSAVGSPGRFALLDRRTGTVIAESGERTRMMLGHPNEQTTCTLIGGEVVS